MPEQGLGRLAGRAESDIAKGYNVLDLRLFAYVAAIT
jgi:hypothetical protein